MRARCSGRTGTTTCHEIAFNRPAAPNKPSLKLDVRETTVSDGTAARVASGPDGSGTTHRLDAGPPTPRRSGGGGARNANIAGHDSRIRRADRTAPRHRAVARGRARAGGHLGGAVARRGRGRLARRGGFAYRGARVLPHARSHRAAERRGRLAAGTRGARRRGASGPPARDGGRSGGPGV